MAGRGRPKTLNDSITTCVVLEREELVNFKNKNNMELSEFVRMAIKKDSGLNYLGIEKALSNVFSDMFQIENSYSYIETLENDAYFLNVTESRTIEQKDEIIQKMKMLKSAYKEVYGLLFNLSVDISGLKSDFLKEQTTEENKVSEYSKSKIKPINNSKIGYEFHHMHLDINGMIDRNIGIYIPDHLHKSVKHSSITGDGMK